MVWFNQQRGIFKLNDSIEYDSLFLIYESVFLNPAQRQHNVLSVVKNILFPEVFNLKNV